MASKISDVLEVSVDFLLGKIDTEIDKKTLSRLQNIQSLPEDDKTTAFKLLDAFIRDAKARKAYS